MLVCFEYEVGTREPLARRSEKFFPASYLSWEVIASDTLCLQGGRIPEGGHNTPMRREATLSSSNATAGADARYYYGGLFAPDTLVPNPARHKRAKGS